MPASPELAAELAREVLRLYADAEAILLRKVARRLEQGITEVGWAEQKLTEIQDLRRETRAEIEQLIDKIPDATDKAIRTAYNRGVATAGTDLEKAGVDVDLAFGAVDELQIAALVRETTENLAATHLRILRTVDDIYRDVVAQSAGQVLIGAETRREAAQTVLNRFADRGITGFVDRSGRAWDLVSYAETAVRSTAGRAAIQGHTDRLAALGRDLVIVSDAPEECKLCRPWEGRILSLSGNGVGRKLSDGRQVAASMSQAISAGLFHANCRHTTGIYIEGFTRTLGRTADPIGDAERQQQRYLERGVRKWKRRESVALSPQAATSASAKTREWQGKLKTHVDSNDRKRLAYRESLGAR